MDPPSNPVIVNPKKAAIGNNEFLNICLLYTLLIGIPLLPSSTHIIH